MSISFVRRMGKVESQKEYWRRRLLHLPNSEERVVEKIQVIPRDDLPGSRRMTGHTTNPLSSDSSAIGRPIDSGAPTSRPSLPLPVECNICDVRGVRLVRDHNHRTGFIRGWLCERCNSWLGLFVKEWYHPLKVNESSGYWDWKKKFNVQIKIHLQSNTGVRYSC